MRNLRSLPWAPYRSGCGEATDMTIATQLRWIVVPVAALVLAVTPLANPLLLALAVFTSGLLLACRCAADLLTTSLQVPDGETVFRHFV